MSRNAILVDIYRALGADAERVRASAVTRRICAPLEHPKPESASTPPGQRRAQLAACLEAQSVSVIEAVAAADIPAAVAAYLSACGVPLCLRMGADSRLANLPWEQSPALACSTGAARPDDTAALSHALAGVAETGTLVLASGPGNPASLAFMPETHIIALSADQIVGCYEDAFELMRSESGERKMPRSLNFVSGASRTGDIGGRIVMGAHGPRRLAVIIYGKEKAPDVSAVRGNPEGSA